MKIEDGILFASQHSYLTFATPTIAWYLFGHYGRAAFFYSEVQKDELRQIQDLVEIYPPHHLGS
ncbi:hypothetical protein N9100_01005 [Gammaproteobacteria bacterium]|nr:hypothetical protein [Gammaproteobacteria bacterium]